MPLEDAQHTLGSVSASEQLITELYIDLRKRINRWAAITHQTAQARMGYIGQHLVSVATGFPGGKSGARGQDLVLGGGRFSEIKTCYRVDQLGKCGDCGASTASIELACSACGSEKIDRKDDSKWLISIRNESEFGAILDPTAYYLVLFDFEDFTKPDKIRASIWEIDPRTPGFALCMVDYYMEIRAKSTSKAPFNLWPYSPKFDLMRGKLIYEALIGDSVTTIRFPGRDPTIPTELRPMLEYSASRTVSETALLASIRAFGWSIPRQTRKRDLLEYIQAQRTNVRAADLTDRLAREIYRPTVQPHLDTLPSQLRPIIVSLLS